MHFTSPLSSILRRNHHHRDAVSNLNPDYLSAVKQACVFSLCGFSCRDTVPEGNTALVIRAFDYDPRGST